MVQPLPKGIVPPRVQLPDATGIFVEGKEQRYVTALQGAIGKEFDRRYANDYARPEILMLSPTGKVFKMTITDAGAWVATEMPLGIIVQPDPILFQDSFTRADENLEANANWTQVDGTAGWGAVRSNKLACLTTDGSGAAYKCPAMATLKHYVQAKLATVSASSGPFMACRLQNRSNFVGVRYDSGAGIEVYKRVGGTLASLHTGTTAVVNDVLKLTVDNGDWHLYKNGVSVDSGTHADIAAMATKACGVVMRTVSTNPWIDDFEAGDW